MFSQAELLELVLATCLAHRLPTPPVWLAIVAAPSAGKTSTLDLLPSRGVPKPGEKVEGGRIWAIDSLTPRTLASGLTGTQEPGLLERLRDGILLVRELSTLSTNPQTIREVFGLLRRAYDGQVDAAWGTGKTLSWTGRLTLILAGVRHPASLDAELGARLLTVRLLESPTDFGRLLRGGEVEGARAHVEKVLSRSVARPSEADLKRVAPLAKVLAVLRAAVPRDGRHEVVESPLVESPHRLIAQLGGLGVGLAAVRGTSPDDPALLEVLWRTVADSVPPVRLAVLRVLSLASHPLPTANVTEIAAALGRVSRGTAYYALEDLRLLGVVSQKVRPPKGKKGRPELRVELAANWRDCLRRMLA